MLEFLLARQLVKPLFTLLLGLGAVIGVACFLMVASLLRNYVLSVETVFTGLHPHLEVHREGMDAAAAAELAARLRRDVPGVSAAAPALYREVNLHFGRAERYQAYCRPRDDALVCAKDVTDANEAAPVSVRREGFELQTRADRTVMLKGILVQDNQTILRLDAIIQGAFGERNRLMQTTNENGAPIPPAFYAEGLPAADVLDDYLLGRTADPADWQQFKLLGIMDRGRQKGALPLFVTGLPVAQALLDEPAVNVIEMAIAAPREAERLAAEVDALLGPGYEVRNWIAQERESFMFLITIRAMAVVLISSIIFVAAIGVYSTLSLAVMQNRTKIAILMALGLSRPRIYLTFLTNALSVAAIGLLFGTLFGLLGSDVLLGHFAPELAHLGVTNPQTMIGPGDVAAVTAFVLLLFAITALLPARRAARLNPIDNLTGS